MLNNDFWLNVINVCLINVNYDIIYMICINTQLISIY